MIISGYISDSGITLARFHPNRTVSHVYKLTERRAALITMALIRIDARPAVHHCEQFGSWISFYHQKANEPAIRPAVELNPATAPAKFPSPLHLGRTQESVSGYRGPGLKMDIP